MDFGTVGSIDNDYFDVVISYDQRVVGSSSGLFGDYKIFSRHQNSI